MSLDGESLGRGVARSLISVCRSARRSPAFGAARLRRHGCLAVDVTGTATGLPATPQTSVLLRIQRVAATAGSVLRSGREREESAPPAPRDPAADGGAQGVSGPTRSRDAAMEPGRNASRGDAGLEGLGSGGLRADVADRPHRRRPLGSDTTWKAGLRGRRAPWADGPAGAQGGIMRVRRLTQGTGRGAVAGVPRGGAAAGGAVRSMSGMVRGGDQAVGLGARCRWGGIRPTTSWRPCVAMALGRQSARRWCSRCARRGRSAPARPGPVAGRASGGVRRQRARLGGRPSRRPRRDRHGADQPVSAPR